MIVTAEAFKANPDKYLTLAKSEDILISQDGRLIARLSGPCTDRLEALNSLVGIIAPDASIDEDSLRAERLLRHS